MEAVVQASPVAPDSGGHVHMVPGIAPETSKTSAQRNMPTPAQAFSLEGAIFGEAGQSKLFPVDDDDRDDDCSQIRPPSGCPVMTQQLRLKNSRRREPGRTSAIFSSLRRYKRVF